MISLLPNQRLEVVPGSAIALKFQAVTSEILDYNETRERIATVTGYETSTSALARVLAPVVTGGTRVVQSFVVAPVNSALSTTLTLQLVTVPQPLVGITQVETIQTLDIITLAAGYVLLAEGGDAGWSVRIPAASTVIPAPGASGTILTSNGTAAAWSDAATTRGYLGLGTAALVADSSLVHIAGTETITGTKIFDLNSTSPIPAAIGTRVLVTASTTVADIEQFNIGGGASSLRGRSAGGTWAALAGTPDGAFFSSFAGHGHDGTNWETGGSCAYYALVADGVHSGTNKGSWHQWAGTPSGSLTRAEWMRLQGGMLSFGAPPTAGNGLLQLASGTTKANGIAFGTDCFIYRSAASVVRCDSAQMIGTGVAFTNGAAAAAGTLLNAPTAGNPTKWIPINDNGTTRYIPAW